MAATQLLERLQAAAVWVRSDDVEYSLTQSRACAALTQGLRLTTQDVILITQAVSAVQWARPEHGAAIMDRVAKSSIAGLAGGRAKQQNFEALHYFLGPSMWGVLVSKDYECKPKVDVLCDHAFVLGLRNPTEPTFQKMTALVLLCHEGSLAARALGPARLQDMLKLMKDSFRKIAKNAEKPEERILQLPTSALELSHSYRATWEQCFGNGKEQPTQPQVLESDLNSLARRICMRDRGSRARLAVAPLAAPAGDGGMGQMLQFLHQMLQPLMTQAAGVGSPNRSQEPAINAGEIPLHFFHKARSCSFAGAPPGICAAPEGSAEAAASAPPAGSSASRALEMEQLKAEGRGSAAELGKDSGANLEATQPAVKTEDKGSEPVTPKSPEEAAALLMKTLDERKAEKAEEKAKAKAAAKASMKRPAAADESIGKKAKTEDGFPPPSWYDAKSRHHILYKSGYVGKGSTKTLTYRSDAEKADRIKQAEALVKEPPSLCQMQYIFECSLKFDPPKF